MAVIKFPNREEVHTSNETMEEDIGVKEVLASFASSQDKFEEVLVIGITPDARSSVCRFQPLLQPQPLGNERAKYAKRFGSFIIGHGHSPAFGWQEIAVPLHRPGRQLHGSPWPTGWYGHHR